MRRQFEIIMRAWPLSAEHFACQSQSGAGYFPRCRGFTLIELLIVVAMLVILSALLLPSLQSAMKAGKAAGCNNNLRLHGIEQAAYMNNQNDFYTPLTTGAVSFSEQMVLMGGTELTTTQIARGTWKVTDLGNAQLAAQSWLCPLDDIDSNMVYGGYRVDPLNVYQSYVMCGSSLKTLGATDNRYCAYFASWNLSTGDWLNVRASRIKRPGGQFLLVESYYAAFADIVTGWEGVGSIFRTDQFFYNNYSRHPGWTRPYLFADGHTSTFSDTGIPPEYWRIR